MTRTCLRKYERKHRAASGYIGFWNWTDLAVAHEKYNISIMSECSMDVFLGSRRVGCGPVAAWALLKVGLERSGLEELY